jgi:hypothetical protein
MEDKVPILMLITDFLVMAAAHPTLIQFFPDKKVLLAAIPLALYSIIPKVSTPSSLRTHSSLLLDL